MTDQIEKEEVPVEVPEVAEEVAQVESKPITMIVWDLETTGFVAPESKILEIGAFVFRGEEMETKHWVLDNKCEIPEKITEITGITQAIIDAEGRDPEECLIEFLDLVTHAEKNVTHNGVRFDIPFLIAYAGSILAHTPKELEAIRDLLEERAFDTAVFFKASKIGLTQRPHESYLQFAKKVMDTRAFGVKFNLLLCCTEKKVDMTGITLHRALADVQMTNELYKLITK